jgi:hypothetical protein
MTIAYQTRKKKKQESLLVTSSLILSFILCIAVVVMGYTKFLAVETNTGGDYPTFPLDATGQILQIFIGTLYFAINYLAFSTAAPLFLSTDQFLRCSQIIFSLFITGFHCFSFRK